MLARWDQRLGDDLMVAVGLMVLLLACRWSVRARDP